jgi:TolB-like protein
VDHERIERRLTAILIADVAGYSRLIGADDEDTFARLNAHHNELIGPKIAEHRGQVVRTAGDGLLVTFVSVVDALRCAVEVQREMAERNAPVPSEKRIEFRMGISVGDIIVDGTSIHGDGVNVAARLEALAEVGGICVSGRVQEDVHYRLDIVFEDAGEQQLKNIARPVRVHHVRIKGTEIKAPPILPEKPSIAVLAFTNMSGDPEQDYFADGVAEDIITALSRMRGLLVIARNSSFTYKGRAVDVKQVGHELGVRYVLEGSVRKAGARLRISDQLINASNGAHLWADRLDGGIEDIFDLQDQVTSRVVGAIAPKLEEAEIARSKLKPTGSLDAYDYYLRAMANVHQWSRESINEALGLFYRAIELDPDFASAYGMAAWCYVRRRSDGWMTDRAQEIAETARLARQALQLGRDDAVALSRAGFALAFVVGDIDLGAESIDRALVLNPNLAAAWYFSSRVKLLLNEPETAIKHAAQAMRLSPLDPIIFLVQYAVALAHFSAGRYDEATSWAEKATRENPTFLPAVRLAAASNALAGRLVKAQKLMTHLFEVNPALRLSDLDNQNPFRKQEDLHRWADGLRKAGLPE